MAQDLTAKKSNFLSKVVTQSTNFLNAYNALKQLSAEYNSESYVNLVQADMVGGNSHLTPAVLALLIQTFALVDNLINSNGAAITPSTGYLTNFYNVTP
jgi:hypothetical protein